MIPSVKTKMPSRSPVDSTVSTRADKENQTDADEQDAVNGVILKRQPVQILGKEACDFDRAEQDEENAAGVLPSDLQTRVGDQQDAQYEQKRRQHEVPDLSNAHGNSRVHIHPPFPLAAFGGKNRHNPRDSIPKPPSAAMDKETPVSLLGHRRGELS